MIFNSLTNEGIFPEQLKTAKAIPLFIIGNIEEVGNQEIGNQETRKQEVETKKQETRKQENVSISHIFKYLERIMYNRTYQYLRK